MNMRQIALVGLAIEIACNVVHAETEKVGDYTWQYSVVDGKAWIGSGAAETAAIFPKPVGEVTVPSELGGYEVFRVDDYALYGCDEMTRLDMPDTICQMGTAAFRNCTILERVQLSGNLENISDYAFRDCHALKDVVVSASVESIGEYAFSKCTSLTNISFLGRVKTIDRCVFQDCDLFTVTLPEGLERVGDNVFLACHSLTNVVIPNSVTNIGIHAFSYCNHLESMTLPFIGSERGNSGTAESVFGHVFGVSAYDGLVNVGQTYADGSTSRRYIPTSLKRVVITDETICSRGAFQKCQMIETLVLNDGVQVIGADAIRDCSELQNISIPSGVLAIGNEAFRACSALDEIVIPNTVTNIGELAFSGCTQLEDVTLPFVGSERGNANVPESMFGYIFGVEGGVGKIRITQEYGEGSIVRYLPASLQRVIITDESVISMSAFQNCSNLTSVVIGNSVTNIAKGAFAGCGGLQSMTIPFTGKSRDASQWSNGDCECAFGYIFGTDSYVGSVVAKATVGNYAALYQVPLRLANVTLTGLEQLRNYAFCYCAMLTNVTIDVGLKTIGHKAFHNCLGLKHIEIPDGVCSLGPHVFRGSGLESVCVPLSVTNMTESEGWNFADCTSLHLAYIPRRFKGKLPESTFQNCAADLQVIYYDENMRFFDETLRTEDNSATNLVALCTNDCRVTFKWKCSCEPMFKGNLYDYLSFSIDGVQQAAICGETDWTNQSYTVSGAGEHTFTWTYQKDEQDAAGEDCGWVRHVVVAPRVTLSFDGGEATAGTPPGAMSFYADDDTAVLPGCGTLSLAKHSFAGWSDGGNVYAAGVACPYLKPTQTLTAVWTENTLSAPVIVAPATYEADSATVTISADEGASIYYTIDGSKPTAESTLYLEPFEVEGSAIVRAVAVRDNYFDSEESQFEVTRLTWTFGEYLNCPGRAFTTGGDAEWVRAKGVSTDGFALRSGTIGNSQTSRLETVVYGAGTIRFSCKVDGEIVKKIVYDGLAFCVDGVQQGDLMGDADWTEKTFTVTGDGRHVLGWLYVKDEGDMNNVGEDCAWLDGVSWTANDPLPALDAQATDGDTAAIVGGLSDVRLSEKVHGTAAYTAFRNWVDGKGLSHTAVRDAPNAWLSYALDAPGLMAKGLPLAGEDITINSIMPSSGAMRAFDLVFGIEGAEIGPAAQLSEVLGVEGAATLNESAFSSEGLMFSLERTADGKVKATVTQNGAPPSYFLRVKVK